MQKQNTNTIQIGARMNSSYSGKNGKTLVNCKEETQRLNISSCLFFECFNFETKETKHWNISRTFNVLMLSIFAIALRKLTGTLHHKKPFCSSLEQ